MSEIQRILVLADVHANLAAFEAVLVAADNVGACVFVGDIIGFGPQPSQCVDLFRQFSQTLPMWAILGNHDIHALDRAPSWQGGAVGNGSEWEAWTAAELDPDARAFLNALPRSIVETFHGTHTHICHHQSDLNSHVDDAMVGAELASWVCAEASELVLFGHFHRPIDWMVGGKRMMSPGSVGQPRAGCPDASFAIWEPQGFSFKRVPYDIDRTVAALDDIPMTPAYRDIWERNYRKGVVAAGS